MAYPQIANITTGNVASNASSSSIIAPSSTASGDLIFLIFTKDGSAAPTSISDSGFTLLAGSADNGSASWHGIYYKKLTGALSNFTVNHASECTSWIIFRVTGGVEKESVLVNSVARGSSTTPNPGSLSLTNYMQSSSEILWISTAGWDYNRTCSAYPTNMANSRTTVYANTTQGCGTAMAATSDTNSSLDPGTYTISSTDTWNAYTIALKITTKNTKTLTSNVNISSSFTKSIKHLKSLTANISITSTIPSKNIIEAGIHIERKIGSGGTWTEIDVVPSGTSNYEDDYAFEIGTTYYYRTREYADGLWSDYSNESSVTYTATNVQYQKTLTANISLSSKLTKSVTSTWKYKKVITIDSDIVDADLTYFPLTVYLTSSNFDFSKANSDGSDIRFSSDVDGNNLLKYEKVEYSVTNSIGIFNVLIPSISNSTDTNFYMMYGNSSAFNVSTESWRDMTGKEITYNGTATLKPYSNSAKFNGSGNVLTLADSDDWYLDQGDFTVEVFVKMPSLPASTKSYSFVSSYETDGANYWTCYLYNSGTSYTLGIDDYIGGVKQNSGASATWTTPAINTEYHIAFCRSGNTMRYFVNGTQIDTDKTWTWTLADAAGLLYVGGRTDTSNVFSGYMRGVRVTKGTARYTTTFTPPTFFVKDTNTVLCMNMQELEDTTTFYDACGKTVTTVGTVTATRTGEPKRALVIDGTDGNSFSLEDSDDWDIGTKDYTMEFLLYHKTLPASGSSQTLWSQLSDYSGRIRYRIYYDSGIPYAQFDVISEDNTTIISSSINISASGYTLGIPYHLAWSRINGTIRVFVNGIQMGTDITDNGSYPNLTDVVDIGALSDTQAFDGQMRGCRFTNGVGRYTTTFTPPTSFSIDSTEVKFCSNFDTVYGINYKMVQHLNDNLQDASGYGNKATVVGSVPTVMTALGTQRDFPGTTGNYLTIANNTSLNMNSYTIMALVNFDTLSSAYHVIFSRNDGTTSNGYYTLSTNSTGVMGRIENYDSVGWQSSNSTLVTPLATGTQYVLGGRLDGTTSLKSWTDTTWTDSPDTTLGTLGSVSSTAYIGAQGNSLWADAKIGGLRLTNNARSDAWTEIESLALKNWASLLTFSDYSPSTISLKVNVGGVWKTSTDVKVNIGGVWKTVESIKVNVGGVWKNIT